MEAYCTGTPSTVRFMCGGSRVFGWGNPAREVDGLILHHCRTPSTVRSVLWVKSVWHRQPCQREINRAQAAFSQLPTKALFSPMDGERVSTGRGEIHVASIVRIIPKAHRMKQWLRQVSWWIHSVPLQNAINCAIYVSRVFGSGNPWPYTSTEEWPLYYLQREVPEKTPHTTILFTNEEQNMLEDNPTAAHRAAGRVWHGNYLQCHPFAKRMFTIHSLQQDIQDGDRRTATRSWKEERGWTRGSKRGGTAKR